MLKSEATVGRRVRSVRDFSTVPAGTEGVIDEDYGSGVMVAWDLPEQPLPEGYKAHDGRPAVATNLLRDGFDKEDELIFLQPLAEHPGLVWCVAVVATISAELPEDDAKEVLLDALRRKSEELTLDSIKIARCPWNARLFLPDQCSTGNTTVKQG